MTYHGEDIGILRKDKELGVSLLPCVMSTDITKKMEILPFLKFHLNNTPENHRGNCMVLVYYRFSTCHVKYAGFSLERSRLGFTRQALGDWI